MISEAGVLYILQLGSQEGEAAQHIWSFDQGVLGSDKGFGVAAFSKGKALDCLAGQHQSATPSGNGIEHY